MNAPIPVAAPQLEFFADGTVTATAPFPGQGEVLSGRLSWWENRHPSVPCDRVFGRLAVLATATICVTLPILRWRDRRRPTRAANPASPRTA